METALEAGHQADNPVHRVLAALPSRWPRCAELRIRVQPAPPHSSCEEVGPVLASAFLTNPEGAAQLEHVALAVANVGNGCHAPYALDETPFLLAVVFSCARLRGLHLVGVGRAQHRVQHEILARVPHLEELVVPYSGALQHMHLGDTLTRLALPYYWDVLGPQAWADQRTPGGGGAGRLQELDRVFTLPQLQELAVHFRGSRPHCAPRMEDVLRVLREGLPASLRRLTVTRKACNGPSSSVQFGLSGGLLRSLAVQLPLQDLAAVERALVRCPGLLPPDGGLDLMTAQELVLPAGKQRWPPAVLSAEVVRALLQRCRQVEVRALCLPPTAGGLEVVEQAVELLGTWPRCLLLRCTTFVGVTLRLPPALRVEPTPGGCEEGARQAGAGGRESGAGGSAGGAGGSAGGAGGSGGGEADSCSAGHSEAGGRHGGDGTGAERGEQDSTARALGTGGRAAGAAGGLPAAAPAPGRVQDVPVEDAQVQDVPPPTIASVMRAWVRSGKAYAAPARSPGGAGAGPQPQQPPAGARPDPHPKAPPTNTAACCMHAGEVRDWHEDREEWSRWSAQHHQRPFRGVALGCSAIEHMTQLGGTLPAWLRKEFPSVTHYRKLPGVHYLVLPVRTTAAAKQLLAEAPSSCMGAPYRLFLLSEGFDVPAEKVLQAYLNAPVPSAGGCGGAGGGGSSSSSSREAARLLRSRVAAVMDVWQQLVPLAAGPS